MQLDRGSISEIVIFFLSVASLLQEVIADSQISGLVEVAH